jgi:hypothetical protein
MKKQPILIVLCAALFCYLSCKKETAALLLPAIQRIREVPAKLTKWKQVKDGMQSMEVELSEKVRGEFRNYETDSTIMITCRIKFKDEAAFKLLPYTSVGQDGSVVSLFYKCEDTKVTLYYATPAGMLTAAPGTLERLSLTYTHIEP